MIHKPTELLFFVGHRLDKEPSETWRQYGPLFRTYSTHSITPELLAALAQVELGQSGGSHLLALAMEPQSVRDLPARLQRRRPIPDDRWRLYAEAARFCIRDNAVTDTGCGFTSLYFRAFPSHAIELASVYLDRHVADVLALAGGAKPNPQQKQDLAAFIHLCGAGPATAFARRETR